MNASEATLQQIERGLRRAAAKLPERDDESAPLTDIYLQAKQESGELLVRDDEDYELSRCVIEAWIGNADEHFYADITPVLQEALRRCADVVDHLGVLRPYSFVLVDDEGETLADLRLVDSERIILSGNLMEHLSDDLDAFWAALSKE